MKASRQVGWRTGWGWRANVSSAALVAALVTALGAGCSREEVAAPAPMPVEQVPARVEDAFRGAAPEVAAAVGAAVNSVREEDPAALGKLRDLAARPDLTPEQREAAGRAMYAVLARLRAAETNGDQKAAEALQQYQSGK